MRRAALTLVLMALAACGADGAPEVQPGAPAAASLSGTATVGVDGSY